MCLFVCKTALDSFIKVQKENSYPKGHWVEEATPSELPTLPQAHPGREAAAALQAARSLLQADRGRGLPFLSGDGGGSVGRFHAVVVGR